MIVLAQQIIVNDENNKKIGSTFPRRARQLVGRNKARWADEAHTEIILRSGEDIRTKSETGGIESIVRDAYRDSVVAVLEASPFEIIKKSKRRTRELHAAFSLLLWLGAAILYFVWNYLIGNRMMMLNPADWSSTWLIFVFAAFIECLAEKYFSRRELDVLDENIDIRQVNPANDGDLDLRGYRKKLKRKIRLTTSAALWLPLALVFFFGGYAFDMWNVAWIVFPVGLLIELLANFMRTLKGTEGKSK